MLCEADYFAGKVGSKIINAEYVQAAIDAKIQRSDQTRERVYQEILRETLLVATLGTEVAQINGLSVLQLSDFAFGKPSRITATAFLGEGEVVDIERETELGGPLPSKGVLILSAYLAHRSAPVAGSNRFSESTQYGPSDRWSQWKIEGFFDVCQGRGLSGEQRIIIPYANVKHLMLRRDVVQAVVKNQFHIYPAVMIDDVLELLTGMEAGNPDNSGYYPKGTVNWQVQERLREFSRLRQQFGHTTKSSDDDDRTRGRE